MQEIKKTMGMVEEDGSVKGVRITDPMGEWTRAFVNRGNFQEPVKKEGMVYPLPGFEQEVVREVKKEEDNRIPFAQKTNSNLPY